MPAWLFYEVVAAQYVKDFRSLPGPAGSHFTLTQRQMIKVSEEVTVFGENISCTVQRLPPQVGA